MIIVVKVLIIEKKKENHLFSSQNHQENLWINEINVKGALIKFLVDKGS